MSRSFQFLTLLLLTTLVFPTACRKGEDDPFLSLRTRNARLAGEWKLASGELVNGPNQKETFDGTNQITTTPWSSNTVPYDLSLTIKKNGTFSFNELHTTITSSGSGEWAWGNSDRKKNMLLISLPMFTNGQQLFRLTQLTNKEFVLKYDKSVTESGTTLTQTGVLVFTAQ